MLESYMQEVKISLAKMQVRRPKDNLAPVVQKLDNTIHQINHYPVISQLGKPIA